MKSTPKVSIALCTYNGEQYLKAQMDSICNQTYKNLEIIVVDDASTDETMAILTAYQLKDERIQVFKNEHNLGFVQNFSKALSLCTGDFIALADQDDIWNIAKIEIFMQEIKDNNLIYSDAILINHAGQPINQQLVRPHKNLVSGHCHQAFIFANCVSGNTMMFKQELLKFILPIPNVSFHDTWIAFVASSIGSICHTQEAQTYYRRHDKQVTNNTVKKDMRYTLEFIHRKARIKNQDAQIAQQNLTAYVQFLSKYGDTATRKLIEQLIVHNQNYKTTFLNYTLWRTLLANKDDLFAILPPRKRILTATRTALGLRGHYVTLFLI